MITIPWFIVVTNLNTADGKDSAFGVTVYIQTCWLRRIKDKQNDIKHFDIKSRI